MAEAKAKAAFTWDDVDMLYDEATFRGFCAMDSGIDGDYSPDRAKQRALIDLANRLGDLLPPRGDEGEGPP